MGRITLIGILVLITSQSAWANSCCGQSPSSFTVLSLEQKLSLTTSYSLIRSQGRAFNSDDFYVWSDDKKREIQALQFGLAGTWFHRHQFFFNSSVLKGIYKDPRESGSSQNLSDSQIGYTFEALPEYHFSYWIPTVYLSAIVNVPTGKSIYDHSTLSEGTDVTGINQWGTGFGLTLRKVYFPLTITLQAKSLKILSKQFEQVRVSDFYDHSVALILSYALSFSDLTLNCGLTANQLTSRKISTSTIPSGPVQNSTVSLGLQRVFSDAWNAGINYADQTLLGKPRNTILNKTYTLNLSYNYF